MTAKTQSTAIASESVACVIDHGVATITLDDGKSNALSPATFRQINKALDDAESAEALVVLRGRSEIFSAGFDLTVLKREVKGAYVMLIEGFKLSRRLLAFPQPVIVLSTGHAIAMGAFLVLSADYRIGVAGDYRYVANEVEIGLTLPFSAVEICRQRLQPSYFHRAVNLAEVFSPDDAIDAGFLDTVVPPQDLDKALSAALAQFTSLDAIAHRETKLRSRKQVLSAIDKGIARDRIDFVRKGLRRIFVA